MSVKALGWSSGFDEDSRDDPLDHFLEVSIVFGGVDDANYGLEQKRDMLSDLKAIWASSLTSTIQ